MANLKELTDNFAAAKKKLMDSGKDAIVGAFKELFDKHPGLVAVRWKQYTPYFNDGEACVFSVNEPFIKFADTPEDAGDYDDGFDSYSDWSAKNGTTYPAGFKEADEAVGELHGSIPQEMMLAAFDDHVEVTVTRDGIEVEEYSHD